MVVKQIRLKKTTEKIFSCGDCPYYIRFTDKCPLANARVGGMDTILGDCPLEDYDDTKTDLGFV